MALWILGAVFATVGLPMVWLALRVFARDRAMRDWPRAPGVMTSSSVASRNERVRDENGLYYDTTVYEAVLRYTYTVGGVTREGTKLSRQGSPTSQEGAQRCVDAYPAQRSVEVLYDPDDPATAYLEVHRSIGAIFLMAFGGLWLSLAALLVGLELFS
jgi:hypothetical protein